MRWCTYDTGKYTYDRANRQLGFTWILAIIPGMAYLTYQRRAGSKKVYVHVIKSVREPSKRGKSRVRTIYLAYIGELHAPDFAKRLRAAERKYGPLKLNRSPRRKRK